MISPQTSLIVLLVVLLMFGGKRIPEIMAGLGKGLRSFKKAVEGEDTPEDVPVSPAKTSPTPPGSASGSDAQSGASQDKGDQK